MKTIGQQPLSQSIGLYNQLQRELFSDKKLSSWDVLKQIHMLLNIKKTCKN